MVKTTYIIVFHTHCDVIEVVEMHEAVPDLLQAVVVQVQPAQTGNGGQGGKLDQPVTGQLDLRQL